MFVLLLAMLLQPFDVKLIDLEFTMAVEESIKIEKGFSPPKEYVLLFDSNHLGSVCYRCREIAYRKLKELSRDSEDVRWLFWGRRSHDLEVAQRCNRAIRELNLCPSCNGSGRSKYYTEELCWDCRGVGSEWVWSVFD